MSRVDLIIIIVAAVGVLAIFGWRATSRPGQGQGPNQGDLD